MSTPTDPEATSSAAQKLLSYLGQTQSALDIVTKILTTLTLFGGAASAFALQGSYRVIGGVVVLASIMILLWLLRRGFKPVRSDAHQSAVRPSLRWPLHFDVGDPLYERKRLLDTLYGRTVARGARVNILIGDAHCGKTSLLLAGLVTSLTPTPDQQLWVPAYVAHPGHTIDPSWDPESAIAEALASASGTPTAESFGDALGRAIGAKPNATFVVIYDQFEQFFLANPRPEARAAFLDWVSACVTDDDLPVRFVFAIRTGFESCVNELEQAIHQPVSINFQTTVPRFQPAEARRVIDAIVEHDSLPFPPGLRSAIIRDLVKNGSVCPAELQIVCKWLNDRGIASVAGYELAGQADGLFIEFLVDQTQKIDQLASSGVARKTLVALAKRTTDRQLEALSRDDLVRSIAPDERSDAEGGIRLVRGPVDAALAQLLLSGLVLEGPDYRYRLVHDYFGEYVSQLTRPRTALGTFPRLPRAIAAAYGRMAAAGVLAAGLVLLLAACSVAQTKAARIDTFPANVSLLGQDFEVFGSNGHRFAVGNGNAPAVTFGVEVWNLPSDQSATLLPNVDLRSLESQTALVQNWVYRGYTVLFIGQPDQPEAAAAAAVDPDHVRVVQNADEAAQAPVATPESVVYLSQTTFASDEILAVQRAIQARFPGSINYDRPRFVPLGLEFGNDGTSLRLVAVDEGSHQWGVWTWDLTQPQRPAAYQHGSLQRNAPPCAAERATVSRAAAGQTQLAIGYSCGPILLIKPGYSGPVYSQPLNRQPQEENCKNIQLFFAQSGELYGLYQCAADDQPTTYRLRRWTASESVYDGVAADENSPQPGDLVLSGTPQDAKELKFSDDPTIKALMVDENDALRAVVRAQNSVELRVLDQGKRLSWLDVGDLGDASPSPDGRFVLRKSTANSLTGFELYEMGAWIDTGTSTFGTVRLWSWMESMKDRVPVLVGGNPN